MVEMIGAFFQIIAETLGGFVEAIAGQGLSKKKLKKRPSENWVSR